eukprot:scaffold3145_cov297-Prasinococcus_capsulatus_cf.AAC.1
MGPGPTLRGTPRCTHQDMHSLHWLREARSGRRRIGSRDAAPPSDWSALAASRFCQDPASRASPAPAPQAVPETRERGLVRHARAPLRPPRRGGSPPAERGSRESVRSFAQAGRASTAPPPVRGRSAAGGGERAAPPARLSVPEPRGSVATVGPGVAAARARLDGGRAVPLPRRAPSRAVASRTPPSAPRSTPHSACCAPGRRAKPRRSFSALEGEPLGPRGGVPGAPRAAAAAERGSRHALARVLEATLASKSEAARPPAGSPGPGAAGSSGSAALHTPIRTRERGQQLADEGGSGRVRRHTPSLARFRRAGRCQAATARATRWWWGTATTAPTRCGGARTREGRGANGYHAHAVGDGRACVFTKCPHGATLLALGSSMGIGESS